MRLSQLNERVVGVVVAENGGIARETGKKRLRF
jgi:hypothetical protein